MEFIGYIILFIIAGYVIGIFTLQNFNGNIGMIIIWAISIFWAFKFGWWAVATFIELMFGFFLANQNLIKKGY
jgi:hypothetical protein